MNRKRKKTLLIVGSIIALVLIGFFIANYVIKSKLEKFTTQLPEHITLQYDELELSILSGNLTLRNPLLSIEGKTTGEINAQMEFEELTIEDLGYWKYVMDDAIHIEKIEVKHPRITYYHNKLIKSETYGSSVGSQLRQSFAIDRFLITDAQIDVFDTENDSLIFSTEHLNLQLASIQSIPNSIKAKLPFDFTLESFTTKQLKYQLNAFDDLFISDIDLTENKSVLKDLSLKTKYSKTELSRLLKIERDHFNLTVPLIEINGLDYGYHKDSIFDFKSDLVRFNAPKFIIYRDKLVADDPIEKPLYSKMLRTLNFNLTLSEVSIEDGVIIYEENVRAENPAGVLNFSNLNATITKVSNTYAEPERTEIKIQSDFMENSPLEVDWSFDVNNVNDEFIFKADLGMLKAAHLNQFMQPNLNIKLEGELLRTYFTIDGTANTSTIDLKTKYDNFDIDILKDDGKEKNKLLSGLVNLFISKNSDASADGFRYGNSERVERDKTKSVFNFIWKSTRNGLTSAMAGNGKKPK